MFLAITSLKEFWNTSEDIHFIGEWCIDDEINNINLLNNYSIQDFIWDTIKKKEDAYYYCIRLYEKLIPSLTKELNEIHNLNQNQLYYETILGHWLLRYISQLYDKYKLIETISQHKIEYETIILDSADYYIPNTSEEYQTLIASSDLYNLQMYSRLIKEFNFKYTEKRYDNKINNHFQTKTNTHPIYKSIMKFKNISYYINKLFHKKLFLLTAPYYSHKTYEQLKSITLKSKFKIIYEDFDIAFNEFYLVNTKIRNNTILNAATNKFETILSKYIMEDIPIIYLELFTQYQKKSLKYSKKFKKVDLLYTSTGLYVSDGYKMFIAENKLQSKLLSHQHGDSYGVDKCVMAEYYEKRISKYFLTWGWKDNTNTKILAHQKISKPHIKLDTNLSTRNDILFVFSTMPKYLIVFKTYPISSEIKSYINTCFKFLKEINHVYNNIVVRIDRNDSQWKVKKQLLEIIPNCKFDDNHKFDDSLVNVKLVLFGHFRTTTLEVLSLNIPTIIFIDKTIYSFRKDAQVYFDLLYDVGILHYSYTNAIIKLNIVYNDVNKWWLSSNVQCARLKFVNNFAKYSLNWQKDLVDILNKIEIENR